MYESGTRIIPSAQPVALLPVRSAQIVLFGLRAAGVDPGPVMAAVGLDEAKLREGPNRLPTELMSALWKEAVSATGDRALGIHIAERLRPGTFDVLDYAVRASPTLGDAMRLYNRYSRLLNSSNRTNLRIGSNRVVLTHDVDGPSLAAAWVEFILASWVVIGRQTTGLNWNPIEITFTHEQPISIAEHRRVFGCPLTFRAQSNAMVISRELFDQPNMEADAGLCSVLERHAQELLRELPHVGSLSDQVRHLLARRLKQGTASAESIAEQLHMSARTLGRRLAREGTTYQRLLTELRGELAVRYLGEGLTVEDVALLLGFSDSSVFRRAFKRWTGLTPSEFSRRAG